jgi:two-component system response regulator AtoC
MLEALIVEDDGIGREALVAWMEQQGVRCDGVASVAEARSALAAKEYDLVLLDIQLPDASGMDLMEELRGTRSDVVVISGHSTVDHAINALRLGAVDFLTKPIDMARLHAILKNQQERIALRGQVHDLREKLRGLGRFGDMVGASTPMQRVYECIARVAPTNETVLITGQSGTGKEVAAATIHQHSRRHAKPFVAINCGAISPTLIESEFFGHERGSFTGADRRRKGVFEQADTGTLFLDEITEMPLDLQVRLLRVLETHQVTRVGGQEEVPVDVRIIAATNRDPQQAVADGKLRHDLLYRLLVFPVQIPPLKERGKDIELLAQVFLARLNEEYSASKRLAPDAVERLLAHEWPGNVRELSNTIRRAFIMAPGDVEASHLMLSGAPVATSAAAVDRGVAAVHAGENGAVPAGERIRVGANGEQLSMHPGMSIAQAEQMLIEATLAKVNGNKKIAAEQLGISVKTLYSRLQVYAAMSQGRTVPPPVYDGSGVDD